MPRDSGEYILDADASDKSLGAVLSQCQDGVERVVAYASRSLDRREMNYCITRKELLAVIHSLKYFKQYLMGRSFTIRSDHAALTWLRRTPDPIGQQARWLEIMEEFDFQIVHRPGDRHGNADALSRRPCHVKECACKVVSDSVPEVDVNTTRIVATIVSAGSADQLSPATLEDDGGDTQSAAVSSWTMNDLVAAQRADPDIGFLIELIENNSQKPPWESVALKSNDVKTLWGMWSRLQIRDRLLKRRFESADGLSSHWQVIWPTSLRTEFLTMVHGGMTGGHLARRRTAAGIQSRAYWPTWSSDLNMFLKTCVSCARYHRGSAPRQSSLQPLLVGEPWERISIDITGPHPRSSRSNQYILTLVDHFTKWAEAIPLRNHTAPVVARALVNHVFCRYGAPKQLLSDRGSEFQSELFAELMKWMEIDKLRTTVFKPSTNGVVERFHRTLNSMLGKAVCDSQRDWDDRLPFVLAAYRASPHSSTGFSPNRLFLGRETRMPIDLVMGLQEEDKVTSQNVNEYIVNMQNQASAAYDLARRHLAVAAERRKSAYDIRVRDVKFSVGDWVWYWYPRRYKSKSPKWQKNYVGPYLITRLIEPVNCVLQKSAKSKPFVVHLDKVKKCYGLTPRSWLDSESLSDVDVVLPLSRDVSEANHETFDHVALDDSPRLMTGQCGSKNDHAISTDSTDLKCTQTACKRRRRTPRYLSDYYC